MSDWQLIVSMALFTFLPRYLPFLLAGKIKITPIISQALAFVPIAVLTVIVIQTAFVRGGEVSLTLDNHHMLASVLAFLVAAISRHMFLTIILGLVSFALMEWLVRVL